MFRNVCCCLFIAVGLSYGGSIPCTSVPDITFLTGSNTCTGEGYTYSNESVGFSGFTSVTIGIVGQDDTNHAEIYGITTDPAMVPNTGTGDFVEWWFTISAPSPIYSAFLYNVDGVGVYDVETVCSVSFADNYGDCPVADTLAVLGDHGGYASNAWLTQQFSTVYVKDFMQYADASVSRVEKGFQDGAAPEPGTLVMLGSALIGVGWKLRRKR